MRYVLISNETNRVVNVLIWDGVSPYLVLEDHRLVPHETATMGDELPNDPDLTPLPESPQ